MELPASLTELESFSIYGENMTEIVVGEGNAYFKTVDGVLYSADGKKLILYPGGKQDETFTSPAGTETIGAGSFNNNYFLRKVIFSEGVVLLEPNAFNRCYNADLDEETFEILRKYGLKEVVLPSTLEYIGDAAFASCNMLEKIVFNGAVPELGKEYGGNALGTENMETGEIVLFDNLKFEVPDQYIKDYYLAFYAYQPNYAKGFDEAKLPKVSYVFDSKGGSAIDGVSAVMVEKCPFPRKRACISMAGIPSTEPRRENGAIWLRFLICSTAAKALRCTQDGKTPANRTAPWIFGASSLSRGKPFPSLWELPSRKYGLPLLPKKIA